MKCDACGCDHGDAEDADEETGIQMYFHCAQCLREKPDGMSPREWNETETGLLPDGRVRVWCRRHNRHVVDWPRAKPPVAQA